ncbi:basic helix-loop-helix protein [Castilleja foliolosa]|uniref:Basic helix-loop-helix protein n=1 Tax=Castilleja foliolosa TaxID=1961234 RepID=A0ABD3DZY4_9LAMI
MFNGFFPDMGPSSSSAEDSGISCCSSTGRANLSDEEVVLACNNPKKRSGRKKFRETRHPVYRGVRKRNSGKWVCEVREPNKKSRIWLGTYLTVEMAARAHDVAAIALRGRAACLNFADSAWLLPVPASADTKDIQKAAADAAEAFRPQSVESSDETKEDEDSGNGNGDLAVESPANDLFFMDEEEVFGMHGLLANMAEGLMLPPPQYSDDFDVDADVPLWSFAI